MAGEPYDVCEGCREPIDPDAPDTVAAREIVPMPGFGSPHDVAEGKRVLFHEDCFPADGPRYRRVE